MDGSGGLQKSKVKSSIKKFTIVKPKYLYVITCNSFSVALASLFFPAQPSYLQSIAALD